MSYRTCRRGESTDITHTAEITSMNVSALLLLQMIVNTSQELAKVTMVLDIIAEAYRGHHEVATLVFFGDNEDVGIYQDAVKNIPKVHYNDMTLIWSQDHSFELSQNVFFIAVGRLQDKLMMNKLRSALFHAQGHLRGVFVVPRNVTRLNLEEHFNWCWDNGLINVLVLVDNVEEHRAKEPFEIYHYHRFPHINVIRISADDKHSYFHNKYINMLGYQMNVPFYIDPPRVMALKDPKNGQYIFRGYASVMFEEMLHYLNGTMRLLHSHGSTIRSREGMYDNANVVKRLRNGDTDITLNLIVPQTSMQLSQPVRMIKWCVMVPAADEIEEFEYFLRPFKASGWYIYLGCFVYLLTLKLLLRLSLASISNWTVRLEVGRVVIDLIRLLLFLPIPHFISRVLSEYRRLCFLQATLLGFVFCTLYFSTLTSLFSTVIFDRQLNTLDEMVQRNLTIYVDVKRRGMLLEQGTYPQEFPRILIPLNSEEVVKRVLDLDNAQGFCVPDDFIEFALAQQMYMKRPRFHVAKECITTVPIGFLMRHETQLTQVANHFIRHSAEAGLTERWIAQARIDALNAGMLRKQLGSKLVAFKPLGVAYFQLAWMVLGAGLSLALLTFLIENLHRFTRRIRVVVQYNRYPNAY